MLAVSRIHAGFFMFYGNVFTAGMKDLHLGGTLSCLAVPSLLSCLAVGPFTPGVVSYPDPTPRREGSGDIPAFSWLCCVSSHMTLITCLHQLFLHSRSHERSISAFVIAISCQSLCSYIRVAKGYLCLHCQAGAVRSRDQCHVLLTQHNQENARMSPDPSLRGVGSGHETTPGGECSPL